MNNLKKAIKLFKYIIAKEQWEIDVDNVIENYLKPAIKLAKARGNEKIIDTKYKSFKHIAKAIQDIKQDLIKIKSKKIESLMPVINIETELPESWDAIYAITNYIKKSIEILRNIKNSNDIIENVITNLIYIRNNLKA